MRIPASERESMKKELLKARRCLFELRGIEVQIGRLNAMYALEQVDKLTLEKREELDKLAEIFGVLNSSIDSIQTGGRLLKSGIDEMAKYV